MPQQTTIKLHDGRQIGFAEYGDLNGIPIFYFGGFPGSSRLEPSRYHDFAIDPDIVSSHILSIDRRLK